MVVTVINNTEVLPRVLWTQTGYTQTVYTQTGYRQTGYRQTTRHMWTTVPMMQLADTHSFRESQRSDAPLERSQPDDLQRRKTDGVPDPDVRLQRLNALQTSFIHY